MSSSSKLPHDWSELPLHDERESDDGPDTEEHDEANPPYTPWRFREGEGTAVRRVRVARRHPWAAGVEVPVESSEAPHGWKAWWDRSSLRDRWEHLMDGWLGRREQWHQRHGQRPSLRATDEWLAYYQGLYRGHEPQPDLFARLLRRNGTPDWPNPFREGDPGFYDFHPEGLLSAEVEAILRGIQQAWGPKRQRSEEVDRHRHIAQVCWALVVVGPDPLSHLSRRVHVSNLNLATVDAASSKDLERVGLTSEEVMAAAVRRGWQPKSTSQSLTNVIKALGD